jgi:hypothetical protein
LWNKNGEREREMEVEWQEQYKGAVLESLHPKADSSWQGSLMVSVKAQKKTGDRGSPIMSKIRLLFIEVTSLRASNSVIPPKGEISSSKSMGQKLPVLASHHRKTAVLAKLMSRSQQF